MASDEAAVKHDFDWSDDEDLDAALKKELERPVGTLSHRNQEATNRFAAEFDRKLQLAVDDAVTRAENRIQDALKRAMISAAMEAATRTVP